VNHQRLLPTGTRNHVLYLAQHHPRPKGDVDSKEGLWVPRRLFYGLYDDSLWAQTPLHFVKSAPKAEHSRSTTASDDPRVTAVDLREAFCACPECALPKCNFGACLLKAVTGTVTRMNFKPKKVVPGAKTQTQSLIEFSSSLKAGGFVAVNVDTDQQQLEGNNWIAELLEEATVAGKDYSYHGEEIKKGFVVAKARWLGYKSTDRLGTRTYSREVDQDRYLNTNVILRIDPIKIRVLGGGKFAMVRDEHDRVVNSAS
jgi:hypothetical protein